MVRKLVARIMPGTIFDVDGIPDSGGRLLSAGSPMAVRTTPDQNRSPHTTLRTPDTKISSHLPELYQNHTVSSCPSIRPGALPAKMRKLSTAASW